MKELLQCNGSFVLLFTIRNVKGYTIMLSIILPTYNEEGNIENAYDRIKEVLTPAHIDFELVFVNDGSKDRSFDKIKELADTYRLKTVAKVYKGSAYETITIYSKTASC